jgi:type II secretion system protein H
MNWRLAIGQGPFPGAAVSRRLRCPPGQKPPAKGENGFTLIEIMMVVAILGLIMAMGMPSVLSVVREGPLRKAVNDTVEICDHARAQAILTGRTTVVVFHPRAGQVTFTGPLDPTAVSMRVGRKPIQATQFDPSVTVDLLQINDQDLTDPEGDVAWVYFHPNGTCDAMTLVLHAGDQWRTIKLEEITGLASVGTLR